MTDNDSFPRFSSLSFSFFFILSFLLSFIPLFSFPFSAFQKVKLDSMYTRCCTAKVEWLSEYAVRSYTIPDSAISYLNHVHSVLKVTLTICVIYKFAFYLFTCTYHYRLRGFTISFYDARMQSKVAKNVEPQAECGFYARKQLLLSARLSHRNNLSVRLPVCLSVTRVDQSKTVQARITKSSPSAARNYHYVIQIERGGGQNLRFLAYNSLYLSNGVR